MMFSAIRNRMSYANVTATLALFFAMSGGALAASHYLLTSTKQISPKVLRALQGKAGAAGASGAAGAQGAMGAQGPAGAVGAAGNEGASGKEGAEGKQGKEGKAGKEGSPWTVGGTLPVGATETGSLSIPDNHTSTERTPERIVFTPISFPVRLAGELDASHAEVVKVGETGKNCSGTPANPTAPSGFLCVYLAEEVLEGEGAANFYGIKKSGDTGGFGVSTAGAIFEAKVTETGPGFTGQLFFGTWAVTG